MKVRAIAVATERSNAVGTVELECTPHGLVIVHLGVGAFNAGYAPAAVTTGTRVTVPWASVIAARVEGEQLFLEIDSGITPHNRLSLINFSTGDVTHHRETHRQRLLVRIAAASAAIVASLVTLLTVPRAAPRAGAVAAIGLAVLAAAVMLVVGVVADRWVALGGNDAEGTRDGFAMELTRYLPGVTRLKTGAGPPLSPLPSFQSMLPRTTTAIVITLTATVLGAVLTAKWMLSGGETERQAIAVGPPPRSEVAAEATPSDPAPIGPLSQAAPVAAPAAASPANIAASPASSATAAAPVRAASALSAGSACQCIRSDSALWKAPIPALSMLVLSKKTRRRGTRMRTEIDIAAVNNGDQEITELNVGLEFFNVDPPPSSKRTTTSFRAVYFKGPLEPGQAIKWSVEARGTDYEIENPIERTIGPTGDGAAPTNQLAELLEANHRPVRLHGALMLAFLGDPRAREATLRLRDALRQDEAPYLDRLLRALGPLRVCDLEVRGAAASRTFKACVHNTTKEKREKLGLRLRALSDPVSHLDPVGKTPSLSSEHTLALPAPLEAGAGVVVEGSVELTSPTAETFEAFDDRIDLLP